MEEKNREKLHFINDLNEFEKYYEKNYYDLIGLKKLKEKAMNDQNSKLTSSIDNFIYKRSSIFRQDIMSVLYYTVVFNKTNYICVVFKIIRDQKSSIYAILYINYNSLSLDSDIQFEYISLGSTFISSDGEYRHRLIRVNQILELYKNQNKEYEFIELYLLNKINKEIKLEHNIIIPNNYEEKTKNKIINLIKKKLIN